MAQRRVLGLLGTVLSLAVVGGVAAGGASQAPGKASLLRGDSPATSPVSFWWIETVDDPEGADVGWDTSIALDAEGRPHISYWDAGGLDLKYAHQDAGGWHVETVTGPGNVGSYSSIEIDGDGWPHISYLHSGTGILFYAHQDASGWHFEIVDGNGATVGLYSSLELLAGQPHISYYDMTNDQLKYTYRDAGGSPHIGTVDSDGNVGKYCSLALDNLGRPHISYYDSDRGDLKYAYHNGTGWEIVVVDDGGPSFDDVGKYTSIDVWQCMPARRYPHISYYDATNLNLKHAYKDDLGWHTETVDWPGDVGQDSSLAIECLGPLESRTHISYRDLTYLDLKYAYKDASGWHVETVDGMGTGAYPDVGAWTSLAVDANGRPHISYYDAHNDSLKYAYRPFTVFLPAVFRSE